MVPPECVENPALDVSFPDPRRYAVIDHRRPLDRFDVPIRSWVVAEMQLLRDADAAGVAVLGVCFGGQLVALRTPDR